MAETPARFLVPARPHKVEEVIRRSRFITLGAHAEDSEKAQAFIESVRQEYPDATHHCWAFVAGPPGSTAAVGMSDDGEPHGTAGRPMLTTLLHSEIGEIVAVGVRYFGGTKLGTGGLTRAYGGGVKLLLESLPTKERVERIPFRIVVDYASVEPLQRFLEGTDSLVSQEEYGELVTFEVLVPREHGGAVAEAVAGMTRGQGTVERV